MSVAPRAVGRRARTTQLLLLLLAALSAAAFGVCRLRLVLNLTASMPLGIYQTQGLVWPLRRGDLVQFCAPPQLTRLGRDRGYLPAGSCPAGGAPLLKYLVATAGDLVDLTDYEVRVNGRPLTPSVSTRWDWSHHAIDRVRRGRYRLAQGEIWLWTPYPGSWDSRYFGPVRESGLVARARPVLTITTAPLRREISP